MLRSFIIGGSHLDKIGQTQVDATSFLWDFHVTDGDVRHNWQHQRLKRLVETVREALGPRHLKRVGDIQKIKNIIYYLREICILFPYNMFMVHGDLLRRSRLIQTFMRFPSWRYWAMDLAMVSKKNQEYCRKEQKRYFSTCRLQKKEPLRVTKGQMWQRWWDRVQAATRSLSLHNHYYRLVCHLLFNVSTTAGLIDVRLLRQIPTLSSLLLVLKSAVCLRMAVTAVASTSWVLAEFPDTGLLVTNTYWGEREKHTDPHDAAP